MFKTRFYPLDDTLEYYANSRGMDSEQTLIETREKYDYNTMTMELPDFWMLFMERATAPFFVFQVFCVGLWCLDEYWYYSLFTLFMLVMFECTLVKQQMRNMKEIRNMGNRKMVFKCSSLKILVTIFSQFLRPSVTINCSKCFFMLQIQFVLYELNSLKHQK